MAIFFVTAFVVSVLIWLFVPEPAQRNSAEMDEMYQKGVLAWRMRKYVTDIQHTQRGDEVLENEKL
ncbi:hypothetical protein ColLi_03880 [Colletotrichum liriopes]|uniref:Quinate permease n=1 Tax=Colletotrichum liriopes TaxID=708192 RepID=A0AA37LQY4_9PEZI|nr:hypothetical protein ColLi_03880 [Colletotrichum liriopes]